MDQTTIDEDQLLTPQELATRQRLTVTTVYRRNAAGTGPKFYRLGAKGRTSRIRYRLSDVIAWEEANTYGGAA